VKIQEYIGFLAPIELVRCRTLFVASLKMKDADRRDRARCGQALNGPATRRSSMSLGSACSVWLIYLAGPVRSVWCQVHRLSSCHVQTSRRIKVGGMMGSSRQRNRRAQPPTRRPIVTTAIADGPASSNWLCGVLALRSGISGASAPCKHCTPSGSREPQDLPRLSTTNLEAGKYNRQAASWCFSGRLARLALHFQLLQDGL